MHKRLLSEDTLTLKRAIEITTAMEEETKDAKSFQAADAVEIKAVARSTPLALCIHWKVET